MNGIPDFCFLLAVIAFAAEAVLSRSILAAGLAFLTVALKLSL